MATAVRVGLTQVLGAELSSPHARFWISCIAMGIAAYLAVLIVSSGALPTVLALGVIAILWVLAAHASQSGGYANFQTARAIVVSAGTAVAFVLFSGVGAFIAVGQVTGFAD